MHTHVYIKLPCQAAGGCGKGGGVSRRKEMVMEGAVIIGPNSGVPKSDICRL